MDEISVVLFGMMRELSAKNGGAKFDMYRKETYGALFVAEGAELTPDNVVLAVPDLQLRFLAMGGGGVDDEVNSGRSSRGYARIHP